MTHMRQNGMAGNGANKAADGAGFPRPAAGPQERLAPMRLRIRFSASRLALCAALAAAAAAAQTSPVYRVDRVAGNGEPIRYDPNSPRRYGRYDLMDGAPAVSVPIGWVQDIELDAAGNLFIASYQHVRRVDAATGIITTVAGSIIANRDSHNEGIGDGGQAREATFHGIDSIALDAAGNLFIRDGARVRRVDAATGIIGTVVGTSERGYSGDGGPAVDAQIWGQGGHCGSIALDAAGNLFIATYSGSGSHYRVRRVDAATGIITRFVGERFSVVEADLRGGIGGMAFDGAGNLFIATYPDILRVDAATGVVSTVAGNGEYRDSYVEVPAGELGPAVDFPLGSPECNGIALDAAGNIFFSELSAYMFRIDAATGIVSRIAGTGRGNDGYVGFGGLANKAHMRPDALDADAAGNVFAVVGKYGSQRSGAVARLTPWTGGDPAISEGGVVQAGGAPLVDRISPNALISVFGGDFTPPGGPTLAGGLDASGRVSVNLAGTCLEIGRYDSPVEVTEIRGKLVPLLMVSPTQINAQAPHDLAPGEDAVQVTVIRGCGTADALRSREVDARVEALTPAFFNFVNNPDGRNPLAAQHGGGPALVGPPELGAAFTPAAPGEVVTLYGTGFGPTDPPLEAGEIPGAPVDLAYPVSFRVGGMAVPPGDVLYAGAAPCCAGLYQFTLRLPADLPDGDAPVTAGVLGVFTPQGPFLAVSSR